VAWVAVQIWSNFRNVDWIAGLMKPGQRINHFPKMSGLSVNPPLRHTTNNEDCTEMCGVMVACCEKGMTARLLNAQRALFPKEYDFYPRRCSHASSAGCEWFSSFTCHLMDGCLADVC
jgi:hypothetical protein